MVSLVKIILKSCQNMLHHISLPAEFVRKVLKTFKKATKVPVFFYCRIILSSASLE